MNDRRTGGASGAPAINDTDCLSGGGELGALMRGLDWSQTSLGPTARWPESLRSALSICLGARFPIALYWGEELTLVYNDAWSPIPGGKHPWALGRPAREVWPEIWDTIGPLFRQVMTTGEGTYSENQLLPMVRHGYVEECYFNFTFSPIRQGAAVEGVFNAVLETTYQVLGGRRTAVLRELGEKITGARTTDAVCASAIASLSVADKDVPFSAIYVRDDAGSGARLAAVAGLEADGPAMPTFVRFDDERAAWPLPRVCGASAFAVDELDRRLAIRLPGGAWPEPSTAALIAPISAADGPFGFLVLGVSPRRRIDEEYRQFAERAAAQVSAAITAAVGYESERKRTEALAEIDRAKTAFFSNVSHEFRTPLTLMLGPITDALDDSANPLTAPQRERLAIISRNGQRLQKLVNTLLDFARIESGRAQASYEATDLSLLTIELASAFESAIARGGLHYEVTCPPLPEPVFVDREMWEKIVLNLISNAFKFTFEGTIRVALRADERGALLSVSDSGVGISGAEIPHLFERFHRVMGARSRTHEGSGIGLALVNELVKLHGGEIRVASREGEGTTFTVFVPFGSAHLPAERIAAASTMASTAVGAAPFVDEALRWLPRGADRIMGGPASTEPRPTERGGRILLADDNSDMRDYVQRLLSEQWHVDAVADGAEALRDARRQRPDLIVADVMMPVLDGVGLLRELRRDPNLASVPVILLSARAGEEARLDGLNAGADDYLVKPFSARELRARVARHLHIGQEQATAELERKRLYSLFMKAPAFVCIQRGPEHVYEFANDRYLQLLGKKDILGRTVRQVLPEIGDQGYYELLDQVFRSGEPFVGSNARVLLARAGGSELDEVFVDFVYQPTFDHDGHIDGIATFGFEVTEQVRSRKEIEESRRLAETANRAKDEFLAMLGHELRNPLAPISTALHLMRLRANTGAEKERMIIERQVEHLVRLVDDLLDISRITGGKVELKKSVVELAEIVAKAIEIASPLLEQRRHVLTMSLSQAGLSVEADPIRLAQVVANLLTNAAKYTEPGGSIAIVGARDGRDVVLRVRDNGIGISSEMLPRVFDLFSQERQALDRSQGGLGLGLAIVRSLVTMHGGTVAVASEGHGRGSEFVIRLPAREQAIATIKAPSLTPAPRAALQRRVLIVDDNVDAAEMLAETLVECGCETRVAHDGPSALRLIEDFKPEVALLDIGLPVMDGYELARRLRERVELTNLKLIAVTGYGEENDRARSAVAGFDHHLVKPIRIDAVMDAIAPGPALTESRRE